VHRDEGSFRQCIPVSDVQDVVVQDEDPPFGQLSLKNSNWTWTQNVAHVQEFARLIASMQYYLSINVLCHVKFLRICYFIPNEKELTSGVLAASEYVDADIGGAGWKGHPLIVDRGAIPTANSQCLRSEIVFLRTHTMRTLVDKIGYPELLVHLAELVYQMTMP